ncbi:F-box/LRR-repeat protein 12-like isoform X1 [Lytechinus pictus]|uniref:F-box/LRR-repeat protein 12-like isoform X1 n=2 Tax=Lytechinus pictus TaxID=7653 RepID=UPI0030B9E211
MASNVPSANARSRSKRMRRPKMSPDFVYESPVAAKRRRKLLSAQETMKNPTRSNEEKKTGFKDLPAEIIVQVLKYLPLKGLVVASGVCKKWRILCKDSSLWRCVSFKGSKVERLRPKFWKRLEKFGTTCLDLHDCLGSDISYLNTINAIVRLTNVTALYIDNIEKGDLDRVVEKMPQLKILHVICLLPPRDIREREDCLAVYDVGKMKVLSNLEELMMNSFYGFQVPFFALSGGFDALSALTSLKKLVLTNCHGLEDDDLDFLKTLPYLEHLELGTCTGLSFCPERSSLTQVRNLRFLSLTNAHCVCPGIPCECIGPYLRGLKKLRKLSLIMCHTPNDFAESLRELPELKSLEVWPCIDMFLVPVGEGNYEEKFIDCYSTIFRGLDHLPSVTVGILDEDCEIMYCPFYHMFAARNGNQTCLAGFPPYQDSPVNIEDITDDNFQDILRAKEERMSIRTSTYNKVKQRLIDILPTSRLTFYQVKLTFAGYNERQDIFYTPRIEGHFNMPVLSEV